MEEDVSRMSGAAQEYRRLLMEYGRALKAASGQAAELLRMADEARQTIDASNFGEAVSETMHLVLVFSYAAESMDRAEAKRIYEMMSDSGRAEVDAAELATPGKIKIW